MSSPPIQWYPGHVAKAIGQLREQLRLVDVAIEVVDARIPLASRHPELDKWLGEKPRLLALNRADSIAARDLKAWQEHFSQQGIPVYPTNGQSGEGVPRLKQAILQMGQAVNERRQRRGMRPRAVRAVVVGFPNVGKSALLNRLLGRRAVESAARPGVTRQLQWVRLVQVERLIQPDPEWVKAYTEIYSEFLSRLPNFWRFPEGRATNPLLTG